MSAIMLHTTVETNNHLFESLAETALDLLQNRPGYDYATFECEGVEVSVDKGASMEEIRADFQSARARYLRGSVKRV